MQHQRRKVRLLHLHVWALKCHRPDIWEDTLNSYRQHIQAARARHWLKAFHAYHPIQCQSSQEYYFSPPLLLQHHTSHTCCGSQQLLCKHHHLEPYILAGRYCWSAATVQFHLQAIILCGLCWLSMVCKRFRTRLCELINEKHVEHDYHRCLLYHSSITYNHNEKQKRSLANINTSVKYYYFLSFYETIS